jgi:hypothetical protein
MALTFAARRFPAPGEPLRPQRRASAVPPMLGAGLALAAACLPIPPARADDIGPARRAFRTECTRALGADYCDCITAGFAQSLTPNELTLARLKLRVDRAASKSARKTAETDLSKAAPGLGFGPATARTNAYRKIEALEADLQTTCGKP